MKRKRYLTVKKKKRPKKANFSTHKADTDFSRFIRERDGKCVFPGCSITEIKKLQCSHFFARAISAVRYDPDNADALCYAHHYGDRIRGWEYLKQTDYREFKIKQLGEERYQALILRAKLTIKRADAIKAFYEAQKA